MSPPKQSAASSTPDSAQQHPQRRASLEQERHGHREVGSPSSQVPLTEQSPTSEHPRHGVVSHRESPAEGPSPGQEEAKQQATPQSSFRPFFTLIKDTNTSQYSHPNVRYIFSDDDSDPITDAALQSLQIGHHDSPDQPSRKQQSSSAKEDTDSSTREHYIVLDMEPVTEPEQDTTTASATAEKNPSTERHQTYKVTSANSLTPSWAVLNAKISPAPAFDSSSNSPPSTQDEESPVGGLMLKIEGTSGFDGMANTTIGGGTGGGSPRTQQSRRQTTDEMLDQFHKRMQELRLVVEAGGQPKGGQESKDDQQKGEGEQGEQQEEQKNE